MMGSNDCIRLDGGVLFVDGLKMRCEDVHSVVELLSPASVVFLKEIDFSFMRGRNTQGIVIRLR